MKDILIQLNHFLGQATLRTYAGNGPTIDPAEPGLKELEFSDGDWYYKDSYTGFFQSWGREVIWHTDKPIWNQLYGGGMVPTFHDNPEFAHETFSFLKKALSDGDKITSFQPRGPKQFTDNEWEYICEWNGDITRFAGHEKILFKNEIVFTHDFFGGLILSR
ncbi:MAG: DUF5680 domain-containing protein [bacterium]